MIRTLSNDLRASTSTQPQESANGGISGYVSGGVSGGGVRKSEKQGETKGVKEGREEDISNYPSHKHIIYYHLKISILTSHDYAMPQQLIIDDQ